DAAQLDRVQRLAVGVGSLLLGLVIEHRLRRHHVDERHRGRINWKFDLHACSSWLDGGARAPNLYRRRMTAVGFPGSSGSVCPDLSTTLPKGPPYPGGPFLHSSDNTPRSP